jgi:hypothetical protein
VAVLTLAVPIWWGADGHYPWDVDNIAPGPELRQIAHHFSDSTPIQYGPVPYYLCAALYVPTLAIARATGELGRPRSEYPWGFRHPDAMMVLLTIEARAASLALALVLLIALARWRTGTAAAGAWRWVPLLALGSADFVYYARSSNPDIHYVAWLGLGLFVLAHRRDHAGRRLAAGAAAMALASKDQALLPALVLIAAATVAEARARGGWPRVALVPIVAALVYALLWRLPWNAAGWIAHLRYVTGAGVDPRRYGLDPAGVVGILAHYGRIGLVVFGLPVLAGLLAAMLLRVSWRGLEVTAFACGAYAASMVAIGYVRPRFALPLLLLAIPLAARGLDALANWAPSRPRRLAVAIALLALAGGPRLSLVMLQDPRNRAENWIRRNASLASRIEVAGNPKFQPRVWHVRQVLVTTRESLTDRPRPPAGDVVIVSSIDRYQFLQPTASIESWWRGLNEGYRLGAHFETPGLARDLTVLPIAPTIWIYLR